MAINFDIKRTAEWQGTIDMLQDTYDSMEFIAEEMKKAVQQSLLENGVQGDLVPILLQKYDEDVLKSIRTFQGGLEALIKTHREVLEQSQALNDSLNAKMSGMSSSRQDLYNNYGGGR